MIKISMNSEVPILVICTGWHKKAEVHSSK